MLADPEVISTHVSCQVLKRFLWLWFLPQEIVSMGALFIYLFIFYFILFFWLPASTGLLEWCFFIVKILSRLWASGLYIFVYGQNKRVVES